MDARDILRMRMRSQLIVGSSAASPADVVSHFLAMQAQDYNGALWAVGLRLPGSTVAGIEAAIASGAIVRTWPMRGTLHFVTAEDVRWLLGLLPQRVLERWGARERQLGLEPRDFARAGELLSAALEGGRSLTRPDALALLDASGLSTEGQRGYHMLARLAQEGLLVVGPMEGRQQTFRLLNDWVPAEKSALPPDFPRPDALALLAERFYRGHGPATVHDLARWASITKREADAATLAAADGRGALESAEYAGARYWFAPEVADAGGGTGARRRTRTPAAHLLPGFDEYMVGYADRITQLGEHLETYGSRVASNGMLSPTVLVNGQAVGVWKRKLTARAVSFDVTEFRPFTPPELAALASAELRYARFMQREVAQ